MQTLDDIAYLHPGSPAVVSRLREIAGPALCVRYHQNQVESIMTQWQKKLQQLKLQMGEQKPAKPIQSSKTKMKQESKEDQSLEDTMEQLRKLTERLAKMQEKLNGQRHQDEEFERQKEQAAKDRQEEEHKFRRSERRREKERLEQERLEKECLEKERLEKERLEKEKTEREEKARRAASNERIRQRAQKVREDREREKREREQKEREEWDESWTKYQEKWVHFRASPASREGNIRDTIPWPVKSGSYSDVRASNVKEFLKMAMPRDANVAKIARKECQKWHPDMIYRLLQRSQLTEVDHMMIDMICREVTGLLNSCAGRSDDFLG